MQGANPSYGFPAQDSASEKSLDAPGGPGAHFDPNGFTLPQPGNDSGSDPGLSPQPRLGYGLPNPNNVGYGLPNPNNVGYGLPGQNVGFG